MRYEAVCFDLFGTLVPPFRRREHVAVMETCAAHLGIPGDDCHRYWVESFPWRIRGEFATVADNFGWIVRRAGGKESPTRLLEAEALYEQFTRESLVPVEGALALLEWLNSRGVRLALVTNCAPDIPRVWSSLAMAPYFHACAFSCVAGVVKPEPAIYRSALAALGTLPAKTLYVGDGSDEELSGAALCGLHPVLVAADLSNTYDSARRDVLQWEGAVVQRLPDVIHLIAPNA